MNKRYLLLKYFCRKNILKGGISYVSNYTKDLWKTHKILKEGVKKVLNGEDVNFLTSAIKDFTDVLGKELFSEIVTQIEKLVFEDSKRQSEYEAVRFAEKV